ncbi:hypothetical protein E4U43_002034 [Claviceps pusilla]|uniref:DNA replication checkpoint mediator MRC1 domain-containing protein n=1 Tax=Claviceps pusilla TaxID=123648 RepID=A0A9P7NFZ2_9HYPO|nr:hypothetical protein E4U43_002034 [Claviceps pusilla]
MASPQAASVASRTGTPCPMTPRSKIRALLATVESSDEEGGGTKVKPKRPSFLQGIGQHRARGSPRSVHEEEEEDSDDSQPVIRPRGKLASRMQGAETTTTTGTKSPERAVAAARERVRTMLLQHDSANKAGEESSGGDDEDEDEDEDLPIAPRRQKRRAAATDARLGDSEQEQEQQQQQQQRPMSPGLFVSSPVRPSPSKSMDENEDSDNDLPALKSDRFKMLVERKRQERLAQEAAEEARKAEQRARQENLASEMEQLASDDSDGDGITDDEAGRRLTQEARPTRKASRKAIEEMNRETQRLARNMQLAHEAKTKKRISKQSLFQRFNYKPAGHVEPEPRTHSSSRPSTPHSDVEMNVNDAATPPSSPPAFKDIHSRTAATDTAVSAAPVPTDTVHASTAQLCKDTEPGSPRRANGPGQKQQEMQDQNQQQKQKQTRRVRVRLPILPVNTAPLDSGDELQITATTKNKLDVLFDSIPSKMTSESHSIHALRALAQVKSPGKTRPRKDDQSRMTPGELQAYLHLKARQQAKMERERRLEILRGQGIVVQTAEEREKQEQEVEDLVAKARQEAQNIRETEKDEARRLRKMNGEVDPLAWDDSEDEEYRDAVDEDADEDAVELDISGSEDDEMEGDAEDELEKDGIASGKVLFDDEADSSASEHEYAEAQEDEGDEEEGDMAVQQAPRQRRARNTTVLSDDEGGVDVTPKPIKLATQVTPAGAGIVSPGALNSVLRSAKKTFIPGFPVQGPAGLGLTQIFAGTMDTSQTSDLADNEPTQSMMPDFEHFPDSNFSATADEPMEDIIIDSQQRQDSLVATQAVQLNLSQSQMHGLDSLVSNGMQTQMSEIIEPSQDVGLQQHTPLRQRFIEPPISTIETLLAADRQYDEHDMTIQDSPLVRKGRLRRRMDMSMTSGTAIAEASGDGEERERERERANVPSPQADAFKALQEVAAQKKKARKTLYTAHDFDRKKSKAKAMVEEQAEESEDEYAGLGGADGEDSDNESTGSVEDMIDDAAGNDADERKLAAFYADRERVQDEQQVEKLFRDITKGMLRRKRGADFDLSDSDSDGEARKRMKRRQFAKMQKALFADERVKKIAENPGNQAFLRSIEDHGSDVDEMDLLGGLDSSSQADADDTQQSQGNDKDSTRPDARTTTIPDSQLITHTTKPLGPMVPENRPPAHLRRTKNGKKPSNIGQVRETLSSLLDEPHGSIIPATEADSDSEEEESPDRFSSQSTNKENQAPPPPRRLPPHLPSAPTTVINRISLRRQCSSSSSSSSSASSSSTRMAFTTVATAGPFFKVPALLRRATTNSSLGSTSSASSASAGAASGSIGTAGGFGEAAKIKKGAGKKSGIGGFAREKETRVLLRESERRREERKVRGAEKRIGMVGGLLGRGAFE